MQRIGIGQGIIIAVLVTLLIGVGILAVSTWTSTNGVISKEGWIALSLGTFFSLIVGCGLITLVFYSSRHGYDEAVNEFSQEQAKAMAEREEEEPQQVSPMAFGPLPESRPRPRQPRVRWPGSTI
jgi:hypothetical protein